MLTANLPVDRIEDLATSIQAQVDSLNTTLTSLRTACQRDPSFTGNAATKYDEYMTDWDTHQQGLVEALQGAGQLLSSFATGLSDIDDQTGTAFNI